MLSRQRRVESIRHVREVFGMRTFAQLGLTWKTFFQELRQIEAYQVLSDGMTREQYDQQLAQGQVRWDADAAARPRVHRDEDQIDNAAAKKFFLLGRAAIRDGNGKAAVMNLQMALSMEPGNQTIEAELGKAKELAGKK